MDGDADEPDDMDSLDISACKERMVQLQAARERRGEYIERLQEKLKALNNELAARKEEAERSRQDLTEEQGRNRRIAEQRRGERGTQLALEDPLERVRRFMEEQLQEKVQARSGRNELGIRVFDEMELMIDKPTEEQKKEGQYVDTVLITYSVPNSETKYNVSYRVDKNMTSKKLRDDACLYWGLSEVEFILKTMDNSKVHDELTIQNCFRATEEAHLILAQKTPKNTSLMDSEITAIRALVGAKSRMPKTPKVTVNLEDKSGGTSYSGDLVQQMAVVPGLHEFMTLRDRNAIRHLEHIKVRNIVVYTLMAVATVASLVQIRPPALEFTTSLGLEVAMTNPSHSPSFQAARSLEDIWHWLYDVVPEQLLVDSSGMRQDNYLPGWLQVRVQQVQPASHAQCSESDRLPEAVACLAAVYSADSAGTEDLEAVKAYWDGPDSKAGLLGRGEDLAPWRFSSAAEQAGRSSPFAGVYNTFDASGYVLEYDLQSSNRSDTLAAFRKDIIALKGAKWINERTRSVQVAFAAYNGNVDYWLSTWFVFEIPASGIVVPKTSVEVYRPVSLDMDTNRDQLVIDFVRLALTGYILIVHIYWELQYAQATRGSRGAYICSPMGYADLGIVGVFLAIFLLRILALGVSAAEARLGKVREQYGTVDDVAQLYALHMIMEPVLLALAVFRLIALLRINRQVYIIWATIAASLRLYARFSMVFVPVMIGFVQVGCAIWRGYAPQYRTFWSSFTSTLMMLFGYAETTQAIDPSRPWTLAYAVVFYIVAQLVLVNSWTAIVVQAYQRIRITSGFNPNMYKWKEYDYANWCLIRPARGVYLSLRPHIERPPEPDSDDED